ncbi:MAG: hypothetical protein J6C23_08505 [Clostridia bacterium]|nr:hypothetical protein [Clostridia bacterium]
MDNKITKPRLAQHFKYDWFKYLVVAVIAVFVSIFLFDWIATTKAWERLDIYIVSNKFYDDTLKADIKKFLDDNIEDNMIRDVYVTHVSPSDPQYRDLYTANGGSGSTILILPESEMNLTGHQVLTAVSNKYKQNGTSMLDNADFFVKDYLLKDSGVLNNYFNADGSGIMDNLFQFKCEINPDRYYDSYYKGIEDNIYGFRIDNLARCPFEFYQYDGREILYEKDENEELVLDEHGQPIPVKDKGYLVVNSHATAYTVGKYSTGSDYDDHNETFMVAGFILERYFYGY